MFLDVLLAVMIISLIGIGIYMAKNPEGFGERRSCPPHSWAQDSQLNYFCEKCNKMPFEVSKADGPGVNWMEL